MWITACKILITEHVPGRSEMVTLGQYVFHCESFVTQITAQWLFIFNNVGVSKMRVSYSGSKSAAGRSYKSSCILLH